jgi:methyl-accepting chemotaxis protein
VLGSLCLAATVGAVSAAVHTSAIPVMPWITIFIALGVGGGMGYFLSRQLTRSFLALRTATERASQGDLTVRLDVPQEPRFPDETTDLAHSVRGMLESLRDLVGHVQRTADQASSAAQEMSGCTRGVSERNELIADAVAAAARGGAHQQEMLRDAGKLNRDIASAIQLNASRAREAFGFAAEANQKANAGVNIDHRVDHERGPAHEPPLAQRLDRGGARR